MHSYQKSSAAMCGTSRNSTNEVFFVKSFSQKKFVKLISQKKNVCHQNAICSLDRHQGTTFWRQKICP